MKRYSIMKRLLPIIARLTGIAPALLRPALARLFEA
jgi:hypothetical protein